MAGIERPSTDNGLMYCDILLDQPIQSAMQYYTKKKRVYKLPDRCLLNISHAKRIRERDETRKGKNSFSEFRYEMLSLKKVGWIVVKKKNFFVARGRRVYKLNLISFHDHFQFKKINKIRKKERKGCITTKNAYSFRYYI